MQFNRFLTYEATELNIFPVPGGRQWGLKAGHSQCVPNKICYEISIVSNCYSIISHNFVHNYNDNVAFIGQYLHKRYFLELIEFVGK